ncbi:MAG TPA: hypothetical protein VM163_02260 [bacterium]|nr:hypothetical protein [bacterium]
MKRCILSLTVVIFCLCQLGIAGEGFWETNGPYGGYITRVQYDCQTPGLCYAGGENGFFRSQDSGVTWERSVPDLPADDVSSACFCASRSVGGLVFAHICCFDDESLFKSVDGGITWEGISAPWGNQDLSAIALDPNDAGHLCVAVYDTFELGRLFQTLDGGATWEMVFTGPQPSAVCIDPDDPQTIWIGCVYSAPKRSVDGGITWEDLPYGLDLLYFWPQGIYVSPIDSSDVFISDWGLYRWDQERFTWTDVGVLVNDICFCRDDPSRMYACYGTTGLYYSEDGGDSWTLMCSDYGGSFIDVSPFDSNEVLVGSDSGICRSTDGCNSAEFSSNGLIAQMASQLLTCDDAMKTLVVAGPYILARSTDAGSSWEINDYFRDIYSICVAQDPNDKSVLYEGSPFEDIIQVSHNSGQDWEFFSYWPGGQWDWCEDIAVDPSDSRRIYVAMLSDAIYRTEDLGFTWQRLSNFVGGSGCVTYVVAIDPRDPNRVFVCTSEGLYLTTDYGDSFHLVEGLGINPFFVEFDPVDSSAVYASDGWYGGGLYRSSDSGDSWDRLETPVDSVYDMAINPSDSDDFYISGYKGVHHTRDGSKTWTSLSTEGLECSNTTALVVDFGETGNTIYAAGAAVFSFLDPLTPFVSLSTSQAKYYVGDTLRLSLALSNPGGELFADLAAAIELPDKTLLYLPSLSMDYSPYYSGWIPGHFDLEDFTLLEAPLDAGLPSGVYYAYAALFEQGTTTYMSNLATCQFRIATTRHQDHGQFE